MAQHLFPVAGPSQEEFEAAISSKQNVLTFDSSPTDGSTNPVTSGGVYNAINSAFTANDAMLFKGTIGSSGATVTALPANHKQGWTYRVATAGTYAGTACEVGDLIICAIDGTAASDSHWTVVQANIDGAVVGPSSATNAHVAIFNGTSGKSIKDSGYTIASSVPSGAKFTDTTYSAATSSSEGLMSAADKTKLDTVEANANAYSLPTASSTTLGGVKVGTNLTISDGVLSATDTTYSAATTSDAGLMSAADKTKLDGITANANAYSLPTASGSVLGGIKVGTNLTISDGVLSATDTTYSVATSSNAGLMSSDDKVKLDGISSKADKTDTVLETTLSRGRKSGTTVEIGSFAFGSNVEASGDYSHAEGTNTKATAPNSHAEGYNTKAYGNASHAEGHSSQALDDYCHAEGFDTNASGMFGSHAEGKGSRASGIQSHAEGYETTASGAYSHSEGRDSVASDSSAHAEGYGTIAASNSQHTQGKYNVEDTSEQYAHIVGNGTADDARSNAHTLDWSGNAEFAGDVEANACGGGNPISLTAVASRVPVAPSTDNTYILQCVVSNGTPTYSWVSLPNASGVSF